MIQVLSKKKCAIPVFEELLPEPHNRQLLELLFLLAHWQGLAKLRLHTEDTLSMLDKATIDLGKALRDFNNNTCSMYSTKELPREALSRVRRQEKKVMMQATIKRSHQDGTKTTTPTQAVINANTPQPPMQGSHTQRKLKTLNLNTYKFHSLGDYAEAIRHYGTTDSFSTQLVSSSSI